MSRKNTRHPPPPRNYCCGAVYRSDSLLKFGLFIFVVALSASMYPSGLAKIGTEFALASTAHNLTRMYRHYQS